LPSHTYHTSCWVLNKFQSCLPQQSASHRHSAVLRSKKRSKIHLTRKICVRLVRLFFWCVKCERDNPINSNKHSLQLCDGLFSSTPSKLYFYNTSGWAVIAIVNYLIFIYKNALNKAFLSNYAGHVAVLFVCLNIYY
jgi:hypothetical protein